MLKFIREYAGLGLNALVYPAEEIAGVQIYPLSQTVKLIEKIGDMKKWQCIVCGFIYDEAEGFEEEGIAPGTAWEDVPEDWVCPECGVGKADFEMIEID